MSKINNDNLIEEIKSKCNIVDVIGRTVSLKKTGANHKGLCPFHGEKTPSFVVSEDKQIFTCFGCGATGDVIEFTKRINNLDFKDAAYKLAEELGIEVKDTGFSDGSKRNDFYEINREAAIFFFKELKKEGNKGLAYMESRGINQQTLKAFGVGYANSNWDDLVKYMASKEISRDSLIELGLISKSKEKFYDKYRNRVIFPIINTRGKVIGFGGRAIDGENPKYLNSSESIVFSKKNNLYGINICKQELGKKNYVIVVEGYMDVISLNQSGIKNCVASLGTALTLNQAQMIKRYTDNVVLAYDSDTAGVAATLRAMEILDSIGCKIKILKMDNEKDPDEFIRKHGKDKFLELVKNSSAMTDYRIALALEKYDLKNTQGKLDFIKEATDIIKSLKSPVEADTYINRIANEYRISAGALRLEVFGESEPKAISRKAIIEIRNREDNVSEYLEKTLIKLIIVNSDFIKRLSSHNDIFNIEGCVRIYECIKSLYTDENEIDILKVKDNLNQEDIEILNDIMENTPISQNEEKMFSDCLNKIRISKLKVKLQEISRLLSLIDEELDEEKIDSILTEHKTINAELMEIQSRMRNK
ncbi:MAG: DNA primase [Eubacteriales bacterium]